MFERRSNVVMSAFTEHLIRNVKLDDSNNFAINLCSFYIFFAEKNGIKGAFALSIFS